MRIAMKPTTVSEHRALLSMTILRIQDIQQQMREHVSTVKTENFDLLKIRTNLHDLERDLTDSFVHGLVEQPDPDKPPKLEIVK